MHETFVVAAFANTQQSTRSSVDALANSMLISFMFGLYDFGPTPRAHHVPLLAAGARMLHVLRGSRRQPHAFLRQSKGVARQIGRNAGRNLQMATVVSALYLCFRRESLLSCRRWLSVAPRELAWYTPHMLVADVPLLLGRNSVHTPFSYRSTCVRIVAVMYLIR